MAIFVGNVSALQFLLLNGSPQRRVFGSCQGVRLEPTRSRPQPGVVPSVKVVRDLGFPDGVLTRKLHVNVLDAASRSRSRLLVNHVWSGPERTSYLQIDDEYRVMTPEAVFMQMASDLHLVHLVELGMLLCGTYCPSYGEKPTRYGIEPLTSHKKHIEYASHFDGRHGYKNARTALQYVLDGSASPIESKLAVAFTLPTHYGKLFGRERWDPLSRQ